MSETQVAEDLGKAWIWVPDFIDGPTEDFESSGRLVTFSKTINLERIPDEAILVCTADTRYKLSINSRRVAVGPTRSCPKIWYYDTVDIKDCLVVGNNVITFVVWRVFPSTFHGSPFERTTNPGLTAIFDLKSGGQSQKITTDHTWKNRQLSSIRFPTDLKGDGFLHISERIEDNESDDVQEKSSVSFPFPRSWKIQGEQPPWNLRRRLIPMPEETPVAIDVVRACDSSISQNDWTRFLSGKSSLRLPANSKHRLEIQAACHSTAFLSLQLRPPPTGSTLKLTYSESYERPPFDDPTFRNKGDRLDRTDAVLTGSCVDYHDEVDLSTLPASEGNLVVYEPFWFRTFRFLILEVHVGQGECELVEIKADQTNYPLDPKGSWIEPGGDGISEKIWEISIRTLRNCVFDGYSDCPFYEQLQYAQDSRSSGLFHYLLSGDDRLMRQALTGFAVSVNADGLTESRYPSHTHQVITGFCLFWILELKDHMLYFSDSSFTLSFLPIADRVLDFFESHRNELGLVANLPRKYWSYVDWAVEWQSATDHPDGGVPYAGRKVNLHTIFTLLYAYTLGEMAELVKWLGRSELSNGYLTRRESLIAAVRKHCFDGKWFTDTKVDACDGKHDHSQHTQILAVLTGAAESVRPPAELLLEAFDPKNHFVKASYAYTHYSLRAFAKAGIYERMWDRVWEPYHQMIKDNLSTWEEDDVRHRSDCHAWGSLALYEYPVEVAGLSPMEPGFKTIRWAPRLSLFPRFKSTVALGGEVVAEVVWDKERGVASLHLDVARDVYVVDDVTVNPVKGQLHRSTRDVTIEAR